MADLMTDPTPEECAAAAAIIAKQNDTFRTNILHGATPDTPPGKVVVTQGIEGRGAAFRIRVVRAVAAFDAFTEENDPHGEHDFGSVEIEGVKVWFKIDLYDADFAYGSPEPTDPEQTRRVLTVLLPEEW